VTNAGAVFGVPAGEPQLVQGRYPFLWADTQKQRKGMGHGTILRAKKVRGKKKKGSKNLLSANEREKKFFWTGRSHTTKPKAVGRREELT